MKSIKIMSPFNITLIIFLSLSICFCAGDAQVTGFRFVQRWPPAVCSVTPSLCSRLVRRFTIHGLWPYNSAGTSLINCPGSAFNLSLVSSFQAQLDFAWPDFTQNNNNQAFWRYQWNKHGTCSEPILAQTKYFNNSVNLHTRANIVSILQGQGINPDSTSYCVEDILKSFPNFKIVLNCKTNSAGDVVLFEIFTCVHLNGSYTDCPGSQLINCGTTKAGIKFIR